MILMGFYWKIRLPKTSEDFLGGPRTKGVTGINYILRFYYDFTRILIGFDEGAP